MAFRWPLVLVPLAAITLFVLVPPPSLMLRPAPPPPTAETFEKLEHQLMSAIQRRDRASLEALLADDYELTSGDLAAEHLGKVAYVNGAVDPDLLRVEGFDFLEIKPAILDDDHALVRASLRWKSTLRGRPWDARFLITDVWERRGGAWQLVSRHSEVRRRR